MGSCVYAPESSLNSAPLIFLGVGLKIYVLPKVRMRFVRLLDGWRVERYIGKRELYIITVGY